MICPGVFVGVGTLVGVAAEDDCEEGGAPYWAVATSMHVKQTATAKTGEYIMFREVLCSFGGSLKDSDS